MKITYNIEIKVLKDVVIVYIKKIVIIGIIGILVMLFTGCAINSKIKKSETTTTKSYEQIASEVLKTEHEHVWVFDHYQEIHPHSAVYKCACGATFLKADETADFTMTIVGPSKKHPHYMLEECSICHQQFENENLPTKLTWLLNGYQKEHPHYAIVKCSQCDYTYIEYNMTALSQGVSKLISTKYEKEHPHHLIFECTFKGCDYSFVEKTMTADFEIEANNKENYSMVHPHYLFGSCSIDGCNYQELTKQRASWQWEDGVCSICGMAHNVNYTIDNNDATITGINANAFDGNLVIPHVLEGCKVSAVGQNAFIDNKEIINLTIPDSLLVIEDKAFENCSNLILSSEHRCPLCGIEPGVREKHTCSLCGLLDQDEKSGYPIGNLGRNIEIIGESTFKNNTKLTIINIGMNIKEIRDFAFEGCNNLQHVSILSNIAPILGNNVFSNVASDFKIFVPIGAIGYDAPMWEHYQIEYMDFLPNY